MIIILSGFGTSTISYGVLPIENTTETITEPISSELNQTTTDTTQELNQTTTDTTQELNQTTATLNQTITQLDADPANLANGTLNLEIGLLKPIKTTLENVDTKIFELLNATDPEAYAKTSGLDYFDGKVRLDVELTDVDDVVLGEILALADIEIARENRFQISISVENILTLSSFSEVKKIKPPQLSVPNKDILVNGQIFEDSLFVEKQIQNNPVSIAIIDLAFDDENPKIIDNVVESVPFRQVYGTTDPIKGTENEHIHGTAMAEIIAGMASNSRLYLLTASNELEFLDAVDYAISKNVDVITISYTWINHNTDGQSILTLKVNEAISSGITVIMPSGNYAESHWDGYFVDHDSDSWHDFAGNDEGMTIFVDDARVSEKRPLLAYLKWENPTQGVYDFDLTLSNSQGIIVDYSSNIQDGSDDESIEYIHYVPEQAGMYYLGITCFSSCSATKLEIFSAYDKLEYSVPDGSVGVPTDAVGAIVVGALGYSSEIQTYSSNGPTDNGLDVPNFFSPDGIITTIYDGKPFFGTSSSAAYVTGLMALLFSEHPNLQSQFVMSTLINDLTGFGGKLSTQEDSLTVQPDEAQLVPPFPAVNETQPDQQIPVVKQETVTEQIEPKLQEESPIEPETPTELSVEPKIQTESPPGYSSQITEELYDVGMITEDKKSMSVPQWYERVVSWWRDDKISDAELKVSVNYLLDRITK